PRHWGYLGNHSSEQAVHTAACLSWDAFLPLLAMATFTMSWYPLVEADQETHWVKVLEMEGCMHPGWLEQLQCSYIANFSIQRLGTFVHHAKLHGHKVLIQLALHTNVPLWISWGEVLHALKLEPNHILRHYFPNVQDVLIAQARSIGLHQPSAPMLQFHCPKVGDSIPEKPGRSISIDRQSDINSSP
ncbi:MAG: hypothetical protein ACREHG_02245, partial [Candidatus Saccharimonadales bacterium]